jgi:hypothetical protein
MKMKIIFRKYPTHWYSLYRFKNKQYYPNAKEYFRAIDIGFFSILLYFKDKK